MDQKKDYGEIICTAVDEIITAKLEGLQYDITKLCSIVDDSFKQQGKYIVSDGSVRFEAYSTDTSFRKGNSVLVTIPNGDFNMQKNIAGRVAADDTEPFNYTSPLNSMVKITSNVLNDIGVIYGENPGLLANENGRSSMLGPIYSISEPGQFAGFTRLGISANFRSWLSGMDVVSGQYGIKLLIYTDIISSPGVPEKNAVYELTFGSQDMIGNPYQFDTYFYQEKAFDISAISSINKIDVYFYQDGLFKNKAGDYVPWQTEENELGLDRAKLSNNLFVNDVEIYLGYEGGAFTDESLKLFSADSLGYHYLNYPPYTGAGTPKTMGLRWIHKIDDANFQIMNKDLLGDKFEVHWFRYSPGYETVNKYAGKDWEELPSESKDPFTCIFTPDILNQNEEIKVVGYIKEKVTPTVETLYGVNEEFTKEYNQIHQSDFDSIAEYQEAIDQLRDKYSTETIEHYTSDLLVFLNEERVPDATTVNVTTKLTLVCLDESDGNYFIYDQNGKIINQGQGQGYKRKIQARYKGGIITPAIGKLDYISWYLPLEQKGNQAFTMLATSDEYYSENGGIYTIPNNGKETYKIENYKGIDYIVVTRRPDIEGNLNTVQGYSIKNMWNKANTNNTIRCLVSINGVVYEAIEELKFGKAGSQGTNVTLALEFMYNKNAVEVNNLNERFFVEAIMYDLSGARVQNSVGTWKWSWVTPQENISFQHLVDSDGFEIDKNIVELTCNVSEVPKENYAILRADFEQIGSTTLSAFLPIPIKQVGYSHIEGAREVLYNSQGVPSYYTDAYILYKLNKDSDSYDIVSSADWVLSYDDDFILKDETGEDLPSKSTSSMTEGYLPKLKSFSKNGQNYVALSASPFYAKGYNDKICVTCGKGIYDKGYFTGNFTEIYWAQPIMIMQSQYDYAMLNQWDGTLTTDEGAGTIIGTMLGAGRKNADNTFSGVLIGDVEDGLDTVENGSYVRIGKILESQFKQNKYYTYRTETRAYVPAYEWKADAIYYELQALTGIYGFQGGKISYSLKENGVATFGAAGAGQIIINGNDSSISSGSYYEAGKGMKIDLDDGTLEIKDEDQSRVLLSPTSPYLKVISSNNNTLINMGNSEYYLQSDQRETTGRGTLFDLVKGTLSFNGTGGKVILSGDEMEPFFKVTDKGNHTLIHMDSDEYYLQSASFGGTKIRTTEDGNYYIYTEGVGGWNPEDPGKPGEPEVPPVEEVTQNLKMVRATEDNPSEGSYIFVGKIPEGQFRQDKYYVYRNDDFVLATKWNKYEEYYEFLPAHNTQNQALWRGVDKDRGNVYNLVRLDDDKFGIGDPYTPGREWESEDEKIAYIEYLTPVMTKALPSGMRIDLISGHIEGYNLYLRGVQERTVDNFFELNSGDPQTPFRISKNFAIDWDGSVYCTNLKYIGNMPNSGNWAIQIGNGFQVDKNGRGYFDGSCRYADSAGNADTVDGKHASSFASSGHNHDSRYAPKDHTHSGYAPTHHSHDVSGNSGGSSKGDGHTHDSGSFKAS